MYKCQSFAANNKVSVVANNNCGAVKPNLESHLHLATIDVGEKSIKSGKNGKRVVFRGICNKGRAKVEAGLCIRINRDAGIVQIDRLTCSL